MPPLYSTLCINARLHFGTRTSFRVLRSGLVPQWSQTRDRGLASIAAPSKKPYYITTPIFYVNADPHVGHLYTLVLTDVLKRWQVLCGKEAILCTGTDEHGMKIQQAAVRAKIDPKTFCDKGAETFKDLARRIEISNDHFVRTTDPNHRDAVQHVWHLLQERGYIYQSKHEGWYSISDEAFYPKSAVHLIVDPPTGRKIMVSIETGKEVEWTSETNYHFRLSAFKDRLLDFYQQNPTFIVPQARHTAIVKAVESGLDDLSVSRPAERLSWGIPVPGDESQMIYVWLDALINYITKAGFPWAPGKESIGGWPADCHVIGKDITRFHCIYWPAFLLALDIPLPRQILTHAHWTLGHRKMSKSTGNVVNPFFALDRFGVDTMRFYLIHDGGLMDDSDYGNEFIIRAYKKSLQGSLGNLSSRITRTKQWSVRKAVQTKDSMSSDLDDQRMRELITELPKLVCEKMEKLNPGAALKDIMFLTYKTNAYITTTTPWSMVKQGDEQRANQTVFLAAESLRVTGILLQPYMPERAAFLLDVLGVNPSRRTFDDAKFGLDKDFGESRIPIEKGENGMMFPPLYSEV